MLRKKVYSVLLLVALLLLWGGFRWSVAGEVSSPGAKAGSVQEENAKKPWSVRCNAQAGGKSSATGNGKEQKHCEIFQRLIVKETGQRFIEFAISSPKKSRGGKKLSSGVIILPLGMLLKPGVRIQADGASTSRADIHHCDRTGCYSFISLNKDLIDEFRKGKVLNITFLSQNGKKVNIPMSLSGFTKAYSSLKPE